jgi:2-polyprenyl-3-methyl-5-hydroxy-6-metoxy-1,4-benzoquinol methylase
MNWAICDNCGCVQLANLIDLEVLYSKGHNPAIGKMWEKHHNELAEFSLDTCPGKIIEIGGGNLRLARNISKSNLIDRYVVYDKNTYEQKTDLDTKIEMCKEFFSPIEDDDEKADAIIISHVLEHFYNPINSLREIWTSIKDDGQLIVSVPNIENMILDKFTNALSFEHTFYTNKNNLKFLLAKTGFEIIHEHEFSKYNLFLRCKKIEPINMPINNEYEKNKEIYLNFIDFYTNLTNKFNQYLEAHTNEKFVFGAHVFTQYLLNFGLKEKHFNSVLDNDPAKISNRLYGTGLMVNSPKILKDIKNPIVVLQTGQFKDEIKNDILNNINNTVIFLGE